MIILLKDHATEEQISAISASLTSRYPVEISVSRGENTLVLHVLGDTAQIDADEIAAQPPVKAVTRVQEPYKRANRKFHPEDTVIELPGGQSVGGRSLCVIAGPCSVETPAQIEQVARAVQSAGATLLRGGAFKPRTSPYAFQGLGASGLSLLRQARAATGLPIVSEIMSPAQMPLFEDVDIIQVGARNMQNFELLKKLGKAPQPILLKRGLASSIEELLMSAEYIMANGNARVILCERGVRTFGGYTRNLLDLSAVPVLKKLSHLPVVVDPSHATGLAWMVEPMTMAAVAAGADGLMIEVHNDPPRALCDGVQSVTPAQFEAIAQRLETLAPVFGKTFRRGDRPCSKR